MTPAAAIAARLRALSRTGSTPVLVAIDGPGGAGKSFLAHALEVLLAADGIAVSIIPGDDFYRPSSERAPGPAVAKPIGADVDWERLRDRVLVPLRQGRLARYTRYDWDRDVLADECEVRPEGIVVVEGEVHFNLALALAAQGRRDEAGAHAAEAVRLRPDLDPLVRQSGLLAAR